MTAWLRERSWLAGILAVGVVLRLVWSVYAARAPVGLHDPGFYRLLGEQLASGNGYRLPDGSPTAYFPVGYPLALSAGFLLTPGSWQTGVIVTLNLAWQVVAILLVFAISRRVVGGRELPALVAAGAIAVWPNLVLHTPIPLSESLFVVLLLAAVLLVVAGPWSAHRFGWRRLVAIGLLLGAATLVRPVSLPVLPALLAGWLLAGFGWRRTLGHTAIVAAVLVATLLPWVVRNAVVMDAVVVSTNTGDNLCMSRRVGGSGGFEFPNFRCNSGPFDDLPRPAYEVERDAQGRRLALEFVRDHPLEELRLVFRRAAHTFGSDADAIDAAESYGEDPFLADGERSALSAVSNAWYVLASIGGVAGFGVLVARRRPDGFAVVLITAGLIAAPLLSFGDPRFKIPAVPLAAVGTGVLVDAVASRLRRGTTPSDGAA